MKQTTKNIISLLPFISAIGLEQIESIIFIVLGTISFITSIIISIKTLLDAKKTKTLTLEDIKKEISKLEEEARKIYERTKWKWEMQKLYYTDYTKN